MKILIWTPFFYPKMGSVEDICMSLAKGWQEKGYEIIVLTESSKKFCWQVEHISGIKVVRCYHGEIPKMDYSIKGILRNIHYGLISMFFLFKLKRLMEEEKPNVINVHSPKRQLPYLSKILLESQEKTILSIHGAEIIKMVSENEHPSKRYLNHFHFALKQSSWIVSCSNYLIEEVKNIYPQIERKSKVIRNHVQIEITQESVNKFKQSCDEYLLYVGRMHPEKGVELLIEAFKEVATIKPHLKLYLAGDGPDLKKYEAIVADFGLKSKVSFLGYLGKNDVEAYMKRAKTIVVPSKIEGFGIVVLEAIASERPIVATNVGGIPEAGKEFVNYASPDPESLKNKIIEALDQSPPSPYSIQKHLHKFTAKQMLNEYEKILSSLK